MTLLEWCNWLELTTLGSAVRDSVWLFPAIESVHLIGLSSLAGAVLVVDLRLLGVGIRQVGAAALVADANRWLAVSLGVMFATGIPLFVSEAVKCYYHPEFWVKMAALLAALLFTVGVRNPLIRRDAERARAYFPLLGATSLALWLTVAAAGRWIGFS